MQSSFIGFCNYWHQNFEFFDKSLGIFEIGKYKKIQENTLLFPNLSQQFCLYFFFGILFFSNSDLVVTLK